jgi:hypothetical protein
MPDPAIDDVLDRFARTGPEFGPGLSNHGPMGAEALVTMGRADVIAGWSEWYAGRLREHPEARNPIALDDWREVLGDITRVGDWVAFFDRELASRPWHDVLETWVARLGPGVMAGATHGILRAAHAVRTLASSGGGASRTHELAEGLGYWAARYQELPGRLGAPGAADVPAALAALPRSTDAITHRGLIFETVKGIDAESFAPAINAVAIAGVDEFVSGVTRAFVRQYLANAHHAPIAFIHTVTAPSALRILAPHLSPATTDAAMRYAWQACASIYAAYATGESVDPPPDGAAGFDAADLIDQAVAARDEHAIKFTDACLREHRVTGDAAFVVAARDVVARLNRSRT